MQLEINDQELEDILLAVLDLKSIQSSPKVKSRLGQLSDKLKLMKMGREMFSK